MHISNQIDQLILKLNDLKPNLTNNLHTDKSNFENLLRSAINTGSEAAGKEISNPLPNDKLTPRTPSWVNTDYIYDPDNPRKPNMRELMQAISGKDPEDLYNETDVNWKQISRQASDLLYGVIGTNKDTRDWASIMASDNILTTAREQTGAVHKPKVDIQSNFDENGALVEQIAIIQDSNSNTLRSLTSDIAATQETLLNFGVTKESIPVNLEEKVSPEKFDENLLSFLKNFDNKPNTVEQVVLQSATEVIANKLSQEIPPDELAKL